MTLSRRQFASRLIFAGTILSAPFSLTGCGIFSDILSWTAVASVALDGIVTVLGPLMPPSGQAIIVLIKAALADLAGAITQYQSDSNPADKATLLAKIRTFLEAIAANFQSFLGQIAGNSPIINVVLGLAQVLLAAVMGFIGQLPPAPTGGGKTLTLSASIGSHTVTVTPKYYKSVGAFKKDWNAVATGAGHAELVIK